MRIWLGTLLSVTLLVAACKPISPAGNNTAAPVAVASETSEPTASSTASKPVSATVTVTLEAAAPAPEATEAVTATQSAAPVETVAPTETVQLAAPKGLPEPSPELVATGHDTYRKLYCGVCHELEVAGTKGTFGPTHNQMGTTAAARIEDPNYSGNATTAQEYIHESLVTPEIYLVEGFAVSPHKMPPYSFLSEAELDALVAFLFAQK